jgi:16S rRNA (uracil1498-N3)-methyltransferase
MVRLLYPVPDEPPPKIQLRGGRFHHLVHVLRLRVGDAIEVFDGRGRTFKAQVSSVERTSAEISLGSPAAESSERQITLVQALPKAEKMEWIIQKGTELGAAAFAPVRSARTVVKLAGAKAEQRVQRWRTIAEEAARQCGRSDVPAISPIEQIEARVQALSPNVRCYVLDEEESALSLAQAFSPALADRSPIALVIGPEGGFERREIESMVRLGALTASLGKNKLRTETAAIAALAVILHLDGQIG